MNWRVAAIGLGRVVGILSRARRLQVGARGPRGIGVAGLAAIVLLVAGPVGAGDSHPAPAFFADGLTSQSSWEEILRKPAIQAEFPLVNFGKAFVPLPAVCTDGPTLRIADPRIDNGVRISADSVRVQSPAQAAGSGYAAARTDRFVALGPVTLPDSRLQEVPIRYSVSVYKVIPRPLSTERVFLFQKPREISGAARAARAR